MSSTEVSQLNPAHGILLKAKASPAIRIESGSPGQHRSEKPLSMPFPGGRGGEMLPWSAKTFIIRIMQRFYP